MSYLNTIGGNTEEILNVRGEVVKRRSRLATLVEQIGHALAHPAFFLTLLVGHLAWLLLNLPIYPGFTPWDPYPFTFLATIASIEAPFIALLVLMHQQRDQRVSELREETHLQVSLHLEREMTATLRLLEQLRREDEHKPQELTLPEHMKEELDPHRLMEEVRHDLQRAEGGGTPTAP